MSATTILGIVTLAGLALIIVGVFLHALAPGLGRPQGQFAAEEAKSPLKLIVEALVWAFRNALRRFFAILGRPGEHTAGQLVMTAGTALLFVGVLGLIAVQIVDAAGSDGGGGSSSGTTGTQPQTTTG